MELPALFVEKMKKLLGDEYEAYEACLHRPQYYGIRVNTNKISVEDFLKISPFHLEKIPWTANGFFCNIKEKPAKHPYYHGGLYYVQEPSAMAPAQYLPVEPGDKVLDLCAAPGGKSTELGAKLKGKGVLISNDISISRTKALLKNLEMFGIMNSFVVSEDPKKLSKVFSGFFDKILVDAPCSGEGMFRKGTAEIKAWEKRGVEPYVAIQKEILIEAVAMLKPGGKLLYSTCTFSPEEDEQMIEYLLSLDDTLTLETLPMVDGFDRGHPNWSQSKNQELEKCRRLWPHKIKGEGHFLALLSKKESEHLEPVFHVESETISSEAKEFLSQCRLESEDKIFRESKGKVYCVPRDVPAMNGLRVLRPGLFLGESKKNRFEPSQALAMALKKDEYPYVIDFSIEDERVIKYLKGETIFVDTPQKGYYLICVEGHPLGWGKAANGTMKNKYNPSWRWL